MLWYFFLLVEKPSRVPMDWRTAASAVLPVRLSSADLRQLVDLRQQP
jgi:hypothetical protein